MGPESAKSHPGRQLVRITHGRPDQPAERARQEIDYGRRGGGYIFGAFQPATGEAFTRPYLGRTIVNWVDFLEQVEEWLPAEAERVYAIVDNLNVHRAVDVLLFSLAHPRWEVRVPTQIRRLSELDRAVVEGVAFARAQGPTVRELGGHLPGRGRGHRLLEQASASFRVGPASPPSATPPRRDRPLAESGLDLPDGPLSGPSGM